MFVNVPRLRQSWINIYTIRLAFACGEADVYWKLNYVLNVYYGHTVKIGECFIPVHVGITFGQFPFVHPNVLLVPPLAKYQPGGHV